MGMGFLPGREIRVIRKAPLGDPTIYLIDSTEISLRQDDSKMIKVEPLYPAPLSIIDSGTYVIANFQAGEFFIQKMKRLGMQIGAELKVIDNHHDCKIHVEIREKVILIGRRMAEKIFLEKINE